MCMVVIASSCNKDETITISFEDDYFRAATEQSAERWNKVFEYTPAPGQFIGDNVSAGFNTPINTSAEAATYAEKRLSEEKFVSLGGFGGYIVVGFDHSIENAEGYDIAIRGNAFDGSSEPGVVWVSQDENGDGEPNDNWYELAGNLTGKDETLQNYAVTYFRPATAAQPVKWRDSEGVEGEIDYLATYHKQDSYYPSWIASDSYTLRGTCLKARNYDKSGNGTMWIQPSYGQGYADNFCEEDSLPEDRSCNLFDIANAIDKEGKSMELKYIDFVKVQTAINAKSGWLGENSTEVIDFYDYGLKIRR